MQVLRPTFNKLSNKNHAITEDTQKIDFSLREDTNDIPHFFVPNMHTSSINIPTEVSKFLALTFDLTEDQIMRRNLNSGVFAFCFGDVTDEGTQIMKIAAAATVIMPSSNQNQSPIMDYLVVGAEFREREESQGHSKTVQ